MRLPNSDGIVPLNSFSERSSSTTRPLGFVVTPCQESSGASESLAVGDQVAQQPTDCGATDPVCLCAQPRLCASLVSPISVHPSVNQMSPISLILSSIGTFFSSAGPCAPGLQVRLAVIVLIRCATFAAAMQRRARCCSLSRLSKTFMRWWSSLSAWGCGD